MFGGGGMNPRKMKQMMKQMGIDVTELDATEVVIRTEGEEDLVFDAPQVTRMDAQGQQTYQIVGEPTRQEATAVAGDVDAEATETDEAETGGGGADDGGIPDSDVEIVAARAGVSKSDARAALEAEDGDLAAAINRLE
ncbi:nascent polypeptide-associated complex protein [Halalkaliarchaeum sp. AArc-GB]|uniref:nascent polypeptide-associated complex protein n=1 Tax=Halalkaliarchaeum sp. AArc-GB TaxID=3074078 RepID=UPI0028641ED1|nr:nascent polypeptide-associated complex protein [Halalkaliarchaeum sp. AArc-GB]MDR5672989.1 nascent polypeptide-associated complex protein [Halalkaliarchaeum sp. AArc-GB]